MAIVVNRIKTKDDVNNKPRRGWHIIDTNSYLYDPPNDWWVEEGPEGNAAIWTALKKLVKAGRMKGVYEVHNSGEYEVPVSEYNRLKRRYKNL